MAALAKTSYKEKYEAIKARASGHAKKVWGGVKGTAMDGAVGAGTGALLDAVSNIDTLKGPYRRGLALMVGGHLLKKKSHDAGTALAAVGGLLMYLDYTGKSIAGAAKSTSGFDDAGDMGDDEAGAMGRFRRRRHHRQWNQFGGGFGGGIRREYQGGAMGIDDAEGLDDDD